jgi:hypothetical protein
MKTTLLRKFLASLTVVGALVSALTCFSTSAQAGPVLPAVGPTPPGVYDKVTCGYLKVFSRTEQTQWGEGSYYYVHTAYWIYDSNGKRRTIDNHDSVIDETPQKVELAPGRYVVKAWSDNDGLVTVPVIVKLARTTTVNLEEDHKQAAMDESRAVKSPSGQIVGWKA